MARALVTEPDLILADEPTGNLDSVSADDVLALMTELHDAGRTLVLITHDLGVASAAGRVIGIRDGLVTEGDKTRPRSTCDELAGDAPHRAQRYPQPPAPLGADRPRHPHRDRAVILTVGLGEGARGPGQLRDHLAGHEPAHDLARGAPLRSRLSAVDLAPRPP